MYVADALNNRVQLFGDTILATISLVAGWNLVSLPLVPLSTKIGSVLGGVDPANNVTVVESFQGGGWKVFTPPNKGSLTTMVDGVGYWIYMAHPAVFRILGYVIPPGAAPPTYKLTAGWNRF